MQYRITGCEFEDKMCVVFNLVYPIQIDYCGHCWVMLCLDVIVSFFML